MLVLFKFVGALKIPVNGKRGRPIQIRWYWSIDDQSVLKHALASLG